MAHSDRLNPATLILENGDLAATTDHVINIIESLGIEHETQVHEPLYTVEQAKGVLAERAGEALPATKPGEGIGQYL